jgi:hypothetical protein
MTSLAMVWYLVVNTRDTKLARHVGQVSCPDGPRNWGRLFLKEADAGCKGTTLTEHTRMQHTSLAQRSLG